MPITTMSSREFNQDTSGAKHAAAAGPVFITDRGQPAFVLLSVADYRRLAGLNRGIADLLYMPGADEIDLEVPPLLDRARPADLA